MGIQEEILRIKNNIAASYEAAESMGADIPDATNSDNLPNTILAIPTVEVVQESGDNTKNVMSQKATTDSINREVTDHDISDNSHNDIRLLITELKNRLNAIADSEDIDLDQLSELVAYIKSNRELIEQITTGKVSVSDIVDDLVTNVANKPLSAAQGAALKNLIDALNTDKLDAAKLTEAINTALAQAKASGEFDGADGDSGVYLGKPEDAPNSATVVVDPDGETDDFLNDIKAELKAELSQIEAPAIVSSVDEMTDTTKHYVLDGYIYSSRTVATDGETIITYPNQLDPNKVLRDTRLSGSSGSTSTRTGYFVTDFIKVNDSGFATASSYNVRLNWELPLAAATDCRVVYYNTTERSSTARVGDRTISSTNTTVGDGVTTIDLLKGSGTNPPTASEVVYVSLELAIDPSLASLANFDFTNYQITFDAIYDSETTEGTETQQWVNSGISYPTTFKTDLIGVMGEGNVIYLSDNSLPSGTYTLKANNENYDTVGEYIVE